VKLPNLVRFIRDEMIEDSSGSCLILSLGFPVALAISISVETIDNHSPTNIGSREFAKY
jgi:hypothetical protein